MKTKLGQYCKFQEGYVNPSQKNSEYFDGDIKWLRAVDLNNSSVYTTSRTLTKAGFDSAGKSALLFKPNTIAISKSGTIGRLGMLKDYMCGNRAVINIEVSDEVDLYYVYYWLLFKQKQIADLAVGTVQKNLYVSILENFVFRYVNIIEQKKISKVLKDIDDKIELNNKINKNLEEQRNSLFNNYIRSNDLDVCELNNISVIKYGKGLSTNKLLSKGYPVFGGNGIIGYNNDYMYKKPQILISCRGAASGKTIISLPYSYITNNSLVLELFDYGNFEFYKTYFQLNEMYSYATGSAQPQITIDNISKAIVPKPNANFEEIDGLMKQISSEELMLHYQNEYLIMCRNTLLPKLMSGEIDVSKIDI